MFHINKYKMASMLHVFTARIEKCQSAHDITVMVRNIEADIDALFFDVEANQTHVIEQSMLLHFAALAVIDWNLPPNLMKKEIQEARENAEKALFNNKTSN